MEPLAHSRCLSSAALRADPLVPCGYESALHPQRARDSVADRRAVQVVFVRALDLDGGDLAQPQRAAAGDMDRAVDLRRVAAGAAFGGGRAGSAPACHLVDDHLLAAAD